MPITEGGRFSPTQNIVSPGVFTRENDLSGLAQGVANIGGAIVAPFADGPAFFPNTITDVADLESRFGVADGVYYGPYTAKEYLLQQGIVTVVRVGGLTGYWQKNPLIVYAQPGVWNRDGDSGALEQGNAYSAVIQTKATSYVPVDYTSTSDLISVLSYQTSSYTGSIGAFTGPRGAKTSGKFTILSGSKFIGKFAPLSGTGNGSGSVLYAGMTFEFSLPDGALAGQTNSGSYLANVFVSSSLQQDSGINALTKLEQAFIEAPSNPSAIVLRSGTGLWAKFNNKKIKVNPPSNLVSSDQLYLISGSVTAIRAADGCNSLLGIRGTISGSFGKFTGTFTAQNTGAVDPCNPSTTGRQKMILSVLSNTQNASTQFSSDYEVYGFNSSSLSQLTSSVYPYKNTINPNENVYNLALKYNFTNNNGSTSTGTYGYYDFSLNENDNNYIKDVFGTDPTVGNPSKQIAGQKIEAAYNYVIFEDSIKKFVAEKTSALGWKLSIGITQLTGSAVVGEPLKFVDEYSTNLNAGDSQFSITNAKTPWIYSQKIAPFKGSADANAQPVKFKLFKVHTLSDGTNSNTKFKIEISNVKLAGTVPGSSYGSFTLSVRAYSDTDKRPKYLEIYQNLNLDPDSANFIARRIGDRYAYITYAGKIIQFGTYNNLSKYIRIETSDVSYPVACVPYGFESYSTPIDSTASTYLPYIRYSKASIYGLGPGKYPSGTVFGEVPGTDTEIQSLYPTSSLGVGVENDTKQYFKPLPYYGSVDSNGANIDFDLEDKVWGTSTSKYYGQGTYVSTGSLLSPSLSGSIPSVYDAVNESTYVKLRKFVVGFQGGFDGQWPAIPINVGSDITAGNTQGLDCTNINSPGSIAYKQAISALGNADEFDINLIVTPGIFREQHSYITDLVIDTCEARGDCFYIMDNVVFPSSNQTVGLIDSAINSVSTIDSNYVGTYYPWVKILDTNLNKIISVPPSVVLPSVYAANDNAAAEWYAPAGLNRGGIPQAVQVLDRVTHSERDTLYEGRVNPIAAFPGQGICVWGQKTLQLEPSALDRINVRRLLINLKKFVASSSNYLVFEQNVASTRNRFLNIVTPYLESVQQRNGIYAFQVKMDAENNTPDLIDRNILYGQIYIQPTRTAEFIILDFNILPTGGAIFNA